MNSVNIYKYTDYREFLQVYLDNEKQHNPVFSHRYFTQRAGYKSTGLYLDILSGKSNLSVKMSEKFAKAMKLSKREHEYLILMIRYDAAKTEKEKEEYRQQLADFLPQLYTRLQKYQKLYFQHWYNSAIREALCILPLKDNYEQMAQYLHPEVTVAQVKEAIEVLLELDLIEKSDDGNWVARDSYISGGKEVGVKHIRNFHIMMLDMASKAVNTFPVEQRYFTSQTLSISDDMYKIFEEKFKTLYFELFEMAQNDSNENRVYQFNMQLFPLSKGNNEFEKEDN